MSSMECPSCRSDDVVNINMTMDDGERISFYSCHACENRWWFKDGEPVALPDVLDIARRKRRT